MEIPWLIVIFQAILLSYIYIPMSFEQEPPQKQGSLESLRIAACSSALISSECKDFIQPTLESCRLGFAFAAMVDIRLRFTDFSDLFPPPAEAKSHEVLITKQQMLETMAHCFSTGRAGEFRVSRELFSEILENLSKLQTRKALGGNGATMSVRAAHEGCQSSLVAPLSEDMLQYFSSKITVLNDLLETPDQHVILEYKEGDSWGKYRAPRSNRFYMNHDTRNINPQVFKGLPNMKDIDILAIGGMQLIENTSQEDEFLLAGLSEAQAIQLKGTKVHIEMGDFHSYSFFRKLQPLFKVSDSIGMNEQELGILLCHLKKIKFVGYPSKAPIKKYLSDLNDLVHELSINEYKASRIHLHTIYSQVICSNEIWTDPLTASARSALLAGQFACNNTDIQQFSFDFYSGDDWAHEEITKCWSTLSMKCCLALVPTCNNVVQVSGLGDNISAIGLAFHRLNKLEV